MLDFSNITKEFITLSPKEQAQHLYKMFDNLLPDVVEIDKQTLQDCCTALVDEILKVVNPFKVSYWKKVKEEIVKL